MSSRSGRRWPCRSTGASGASRSRCDSNGSCRACSSDAHHARLVGTAWTDFEGTSMAELRRAIAERTTTPDGRHWTLGEHLDGVARQQWRSMVKDPVKRARRRMGRKKAK
ncbi:MAG: hypothetical protein E6J52_12730 [Chloroflexi bacterium]|nr:MAG: hypothetical protein E6J52_12730 [Chloroflexota bacterium]